MNIELDYNNLSIFYGRTSESVAKIYARVEGFDSDDRTTLRGTVRGPFCRFSQTLPTTVSLTDLGPGESLLAEAVLPDPCFWSPQLPALYEANVELVSSGKSVAHAERQLGIRMFGTSGDSFRMNGNRVVVRGFRAETVPNKEFDYLRETSTMLFVNNPDDQLCQKASEDGIPLAAWFSSETPDIDLHIRRLAQWAAVTLVVIDCRSPKDWQPKQLSPNATFIQQIGTASGISVADWADAVLVNVESLESGLAQLPPNQTVIAYRASKDKQLPLELRAECDRLQRDLAASGDFAGYVV